jgi:hypothetical protein
MKNTKELLLALLHLFPIDRHDLTLYNLNLKGKTLDHDHDRLLFKRFKELSWFLMAFSKFVQAPRIQFVTLAIWLVRRRNHSLRLLLFFDRWKRLEVCRSFIGVRLFPMSFFSNVTDSHSGLGGLLLWPLTMIIPLIWTVSITKSKLKVKKHLLKIADDFVYVYLGSAPKVFAIGKDVK